MVMAFAEANDGCKAGHHRHIASAALQLSKEISKEKLNNCNGFRTIPDSSAGNNC